MRFVKSFYQWLSFLLLVIVTSILTSAFSEETRMKILERDGFACQLCGSSFDKLEAAHLDHNRSQPHYDHPDTGITLCTSCHLDHHLGYRGRASDIGLTEDQNNWAIEQIRDRLKQNSQPRY